MDAATASLRSSRPVNGSQLFASSSPIAARVASIASAGGGMSVSRFSRRRTSGSSPAAAATRSMLNPGMSRSRVTPLGFSPLSTATATISRTGSRRSTPALAKAELLTGAARLTTWSAGGGVDVNRDTSRFGPSFSIPCLYSCPRDASDEGRTMIDDMLVVDAVVHAGNVTRENVAEPIQPMADPLIEAIYGLHVQLSPESHRLAPEELLRGWSGEEVERLLFLQRGVDLCDYLSLPLDD